MSWQHFKQTWLIKFWAPAPAVIAAGILSTYYFGITGTFWAVTGEFTRWGGQILQLFGVHAEQWGYYKLIHLEGTPLTRIDGMMILGMFGGCFAAALWANNVKLRMPRSRIRIVQAVAGGIIAGFGARLAMGCNWPPFYRDPAVLPTRVVLCAGDRYRLLVRRPLYVAADISHTGENAEGLRGFATDAETGSGKTAFQARYAGLYRHDWLGVINGNASAETGAGDAVRRRVWAADRTRANLLYLGLSRSVDLRTRPYGESDYFRHGGQRHWYFQLRAVGRCT